MDTLDVVVIGGGVGGIAIPRTLALTGREVVLLERHSRIGEETSSRNSEVIHAGIYYQTNSLKALLCVSGKELLYSYCEEKSIPYDRCGKVIVALTKDQEETLDIIRTRAIDNGVEDLQSMTAAEVSDLEPAVKCIAGLFSPSTGIVDAHSLMVALRGDLENAGGNVAFLSTFSQASFESDRFRLRVATEESTTEVGARCLINAAGLQASRVARRIAALDPRHIPETRFAKGNYFVYQAQHPFQHLIYPVPEPGGLGIHVTLDLAGGARFGPNVEWVDEPEYSVSSQHMDRFFDTIKGYWPNVSRDALTPGYAGVRPKIVGPGDPPGDFVIQGPGDHGIPGLVNLFGIESPGLTASLAIAETVREALL